MSYSKCGNNSLTSCSCQDNCPDKTSELLFDGTFSSISVPDGATLNDVLLLLEEYTLETVNNLNLTYTIGPSNCIGLVAGEYGYSQIFDAVNSTICSLSSNVSQIESDLSDLQVTVTDSLADIQADITDIQADIVDIQANIIDSMPLGSMIMYPVATPPSVKWLLCEGQSLSTTTYSDLFTLVGYSFGGSGASFNLPDMRGKFFAGYDATGSADYQTIGQGAGSDSVSLTKTQLPNHQHTIGTADGGSISNPGNHDHRGGETFNAVLEGGTLAPGDQSWDLNEDSNPPTLYRTNQFPYADGAHTHTGVTGDGTSDGLSGAPHENRPSFIVFPWAIKVTN